jgi:hypothetical protein
VWGCREKPWGCKEKQRAYILFFQIFLTFDFFFLSLPSLALTISLSSHSCVLGFSRTRMNTSSPAILRRSNHIPATARQPRPPATTANHSTGNLKPTKKNPKSLPKHLCISFKHKSKSKSKHEIKINKPKPKNKQVPLFFYLLFLLFDFLFVFVGYFLFWLWFFD